MVTSLYSSPTFKVFNDNLNFEMDKTAHMMVSGGLYYQGLVFQDSTQNETKAAVFAFCIGVGWETYQGLAHKRHGGFSVQDLQYNVLGIFLAHLQKEIWFYFKKIKSNKKLTHFSDK